jgi:hypothetical protein
MPIQIIDNFDLTTAKPIDNRIVVGPTPSFYQNKDSIPNKYQGMRIWELPGSNLTSGGTNSTADGLAYVWTGSAWISENTTSISGSGTVGRVAYFSAANTIQSSNIYFANNNIGIGANAESFSGAKLFVSGSIKTSLNFVGPGSGITSINASNISSGTLDVLRFGGANSGWILTSNNINSASYKNPSTINVGSATVLQNTRSIWGKPFNGSSDITGDISLGGHIYRAKSIVLLSGGVDSVGTFRATIQFNVSAAANKTILIPIDVPNTSTFAFLERIQTFSAAQTMGSSLTVNGSTTLNSSLIVNLSSSQKLRVGDISIVIGPDSNGTPIIRTGNNTSPAAPSFTWYGDDGTGIYRPVANVMGFVTNAVERMRISNNGVRLGFKGVDVKTHVSGYVKFTRNSNGTGFNYSGDQKGGVTAVADISGSGSSFSGGDGWIRIRITFPTGTFQGSTDDNIVLVSFGLDDTSGSILYFCQNIAGKVISTNEIEVRMEFKSTPSGGYNIRLNFIVQSL